MSFKPEELPSDTQERINAMDSCEFVVRNGIKVVSVAEDEVRVVMEPGGNMNAMGSIHGGAIFSLADQAFAVAANMNGDPQVSISANITFIRPASGRLEAVAKKAGETRRTSIYQVTVFEGEEVVAIFQGIGYKLRDPINERDEISG